MAIPDNATCRLSGDISNLPDPSNEPQTPTNNETREEPIRQSTTGDPFDDFTSGLTPVKQQPEALARLESWLVELPARNSRFDFRVATGMTVTLNGSDGNHCFGVEQIDNNWQESSPRVAIAKAPGLAATIHAALEKAEEIQL